MRHSCGFRAWQVRGRALLKGGGGTGARAGERPDGNAALLRVWTYAIMQCELPLMTCAHQQVPSDKTIGQRAAIMRALVQGCVQRAIVRTDDGEVRVAFARGCNVARR